MKLLILILILCFTVKADPLKPLPIKFLEKKKKKKQKKKHYINYDSIQDEDL